MAAQNYQTYRMLAPLRTHWRVVSCDQAECAAYQFGWVTTVDLATKLGQKQADFIRHDRSRSHTEQRVSESLVKFVFGPGQRCFATAGPEFPAGTHKVRNLRPHRYLVVGGDFRGNPRGDFREHRRAEDWVEDFSGHQDLISAAIQQGLRPRACQPG